MEDEIEMHDDVQPDVLDEIAQGTIKSDEQAGKLILDGILELDPYVRFLDGQPV